MITHAEFILNLIKENNDTINIIMAKPSVKDDMPSLKLTLAINAKEAMLTPSNIPDIQEEFLIFGIKGFNTQTSINDGRNIPIVANIAPGMPLNKYPINVAVVNTGPGVN